MLRRFLANALAACAALIPGGASCRAGEAYTFETYATVDYSGTAAAIASSTVWSFLGPIEEPGFRLKVDSFTGIYGQSNASLFSSAFMAADLNMLADVMAGYQFHWDRFWIKAYAGGAYQAQTQIFWSIGQMVPLKEFAAAAAIETYWQGPGRLWASMNVSWLEFDNTVSFYDRVAYEAVRDYEGLKVSVGAELGAIFKSADLYSVGRRLDDEESFVKGGPLLNLRYYSPTSPFRRASRKRAATAFGAPTPRSAMARSSDAAPLRGGGLSRLQRLTTSPCPSPGRREAAAA